MHLGHPMAGTDFVFPAQGENGVLQPGQLLSNEAVQKLLNEATPGAGIPETFSAHCFQCGGAQYCFMFALKPWLLRRVHWWGGWAKGEQVSARFHKVVHMAHVLSYLGWPDVLTDLCFLSLSPFLPPFSLVIAEGHPHEVPSQ